MQNSDHIVEINDDPRLKHCLLCFHIIMTIIIRLLFNRKPQPTIGNQLAEFHSRWRAGSEEKLWQMEENLHCVIIDRTLYRIGRGTDVGHSLLESSTMVHGSLLHRAAGGRQHGWLLYFYKDPY